MSCLFPYRYLPLSTLIVHCYVDGTDNEPMANVGFKVTDGNDGSIGPDDGVYYADRAGNIELPDLEPGLTVKVRMFKIAPEYVLDGVPQDIVMESGAVQELTFWAKRQGALTVRVLDSLTREPVPNAEFKLAYADGRPVDAANGQVSGAGQYFTDSNGEISVTGVTGTVIVTQEKPNDKYTIDADKRGKTVTVNPAETQTLTFFNTPAQALTAQLYVRGTTDPIAGARFLLTNGRGAKLGDENGEFVTDENGRFALSGLTPGVTVSAKQLTTADGYLMDGTPKTIEIKSGNAQNLTFYNDPAQILTVRLYVKGTTTPIAGASFLVRSGGGAFIGDNNGEFTTDRNGQFVITGLTPGVTVTATQTATVSGYIPDTSPQNILIKKGNAQSVTFYNAPKGALTVRKLDSVTEESLQGAEFKITTVQGTPVDSHEGKTSSNGIYTTDASGEIAIEKLEPGVYTVVETKAPDGYALDRTPHGVFCQGRQCRFFNEFYK